MKNRKWAKILLMGLALGIGSAAADIPQTACAAEGVDGFSDVPKDHWAYEALDYLAEDGIIEGYEDGTFRGGRTMTRYEMASIVAKAMMKGGGSLVDIAVLEKMQREFDQELQTLKQQVAQNTKDIAELKKEQDRVKLYGYIRAQWQNDNRNDGEPYADQNTNRRFMLDLRGDFKINPEWVGHFDVEAKQHYTHQSFDGGRISHEDGTFKRLWLTGNFKNGLEITAGRRWRRWE